MISTKKWLKIVLISISGLAIVSLATFLPVLSVKTNKMTALKGEYVSVHYENEEAAAADIFEKANAESERIAKSLGFSTPQNINIYIYDSQRTFQTKKYGLMALLLDVEWYIGDNKGTDVLLTSPANPGSYHSYDEIVNEVQVHEMVHAYNSILNKKMRLWFNEGLAGYLSNQVPQFSIHDEYAIPGIAQMQTSNPVEFANMDGYPLSYTYIEYLNNAYGWENVLTLARSNDYVTAFGVEESEIYKNWIDFLRISYSE